MAEPEFFTLETTYSFNYKTKKPVPIPEIITSLENLEKLLERTPGLIEKAFVELQVVSMSVYVSSLKSGSLKEEFLIKYVFKGRENYEKAKEVYDKLLEDNTVIRSVVALGMGALIGYGVFSAMQPGQSTTQIEAYNNTIINVGADVGVEASDISAFLKATKDKKTLARQAVAVVKPAKADPDATIEMDEIPELTVGREFIRSTPDEYEPPVPTEKTESYSDVGIVIYASDRDKSDKAWAGIVPGVVDHRVRFVLADDVDPRKLHGRTQVRGDIVVTYRFVRSKKEYEPKLVEIDAVNLRPKGK
ncbi:hypothetical protein [Marinobacter nauticus]|uniref:hypothetical protein n=1 Tax=Marinobacter nauticus TaxID=2743 RepID=UPI001C96F46F|nr:hypothetical protein [Marinobacter nauticus]MBY6102328.1 hypothetical protein [Marinobacter nauticus]